MTPLITIDNVVKTYPGVQAVSGATFTIDPGEILGIVGKNGAGKSTLIKMLAGATTPTSGEIRVGDTALNQQHTPRVAHQLGLAFMFQELETLPGLSVVDNVALGTRPPRRLGAFVSRRELARRVQAVLDRLDPSIESAARIDDLSPAQLRLVMIARALYHRARAVFLDEPTTSLSTAEIQQLHAVTRSLAQDGTAVVYVSHRLDEILSLTDRIVVMRDGRVVDVRATSAHDHPSLIASITGENATSTGQQRRRGSVRSIPEAQPALSVRGLSTAHVHDIDLDVRRGEILGLAGLVGSGRTELARALFGLDHSRARTFTLAGQPFIPRSPRAAIAAGIALLPEDRRHEGLILDASVRENVTLSSLAAFRAKRRLPFPSRGRERASTLEHMRNLSIRTPSVEQPVGLLSGGNQQKVVIAKWLQVNPLVLLFDEPTQGIDVGAKEEVYRLIEALAEAGHGIVFISSEFSELVGTCHRVVVMREGTIVARLEGPAVNEETIVAACYRNDASAARERGTG